MRWVVEAFKDFVERLSPVGELKREEGPKEAITELKSLMRGQLIGDNSSGNLKMSGSLSGRITKTPIHGEERKSAVHLEIAKGKKALIDFAN